MDKQGGRKKLVTGDGKGVKKRGEGLGTGPVGRKDGYSGRKESSSGSSGGGRPIGGGYDGEETTRAGGRGGMMIIVIIAAIVLLGGGGGLFGGLFGGGSDTDEQMPAQTQSGYTQPAQTQAATQPAQTQAAQQDIYGMLTGFTGNNSTSTGWSTGTTATNTGTLNRDVAPGSRPKRTSIIGQGADQITIMIYMCGTDLESKNGFASNDIQEICKAAQSDHVNILIYTGGSRSWKIQGISNDVNQIYRVNNGGLERVLADDGRKVMTDPATLAGFITWCAQNYPANRFDLIFWDHGGGSLSGYGYDEKNPRSGSMTLAGIRKALSTANVTFDFIGFDTCLMATLENALVVADYADYLIASEETEPGVGWYYTDWLTSLANDPSQATLDTGRNIIDGFVNECNRKCPGQKATLSMIDLAELTNTVPPALSAFSEGTSALISSDNYQVVSEARADCREFSPSSKIDQIDLVDFAEKIGTREAQALAEALIGAVKYNRTSSNMTNSYGVSIYFPYKQVSKVDSVTNVYREIGMDEDYAKCIKSFAGLAVAGQISAGGTSSPLDSLFGGGSTGGFGSSDILGGLLSSFLGGGRSISGIDPSDVQFLAEDDVDLDALAQYVATNHFDASQMVWTKDDQGRNVMALADDQWALITSLQMNMFYDDGEGYIDLGLDNLYEFTEDGRLIGDTDNTWLSIDGQPVAFYYETTIIDEGKETITGRVPAKLNGEIVNLIIVFDDENPYGYIAGARYDYRGGETETEAKSFTELNEGDVLEFLCDYYSYDGTYQDTYLLGDPMEYHSGMQISNTYVGENVQVTYLLTDIYHQEYWTPVVP